MLFNSYSFFVFFPIVVVVYFLLPKRVSYLWLLTASYYFTWGGMQSMHYCCYCLQQLLT